MPLFKLCWYSPVEKSPANWICWKSPIYAENAEYAKNAEYVENAEHAEYAEYAKPVKAVKAWVRVAFGKSLFCYPSPSPKKKRKKEHMFWVSPPQILVGNPFLF